MQALNNMQKQDHLVEIKNRIGKSTQRFNLENWLHTAGGGVCVGRWRATGGASPAAPIGAYSWGVWWEDAGVGAYRIHDPFGNLMAYRLDVVKDTKIYKNQNDSVLEFTDLVIDMWIWPEGESDLSVSKAPEESITVEDLDELSQLFAAGAVSQEDHNYAKSVMNDVIKCPDLYISGIDLMIETAIAKNL